MSRVLLRYDEPLTVVRLGPGADVPDWASSGTLLSVTATAAETSVVCGAAGVPRKAKAHGPWTAFAVEGPLDLALTGVLHELLAPLAEAAIPVFTVATFDTDWILVPAGDADRAAEEWRRRGTEIRSAATIESEGQE
ncbi:ACT domain-containing protein [Nocardioides caldifontis]|uniref:ACT domain-containing protein n=1 Tax=Nocardioides caldifontis TaxID=2588938 RepID=UPI0013967BB6|nr:ACT domain-containing protein [Nocardioides caldifontis]